MALELQTISVSLSSGVDTKTDPKAIIEGKLTLLENAVFTSPGKLQKRYGYSSFTQNVLASSGSPTVAAGSTLTSFNDALVLSDGSSVYSYASESAKWAKAVGQVSSTSLKVRGVSSGFAGLIDIGLITNPSTVSAVASDGNEGYVTLLPSSNATVIFTVYSPATNTVVYSVTKSYSSIGNTSARGVTIQAIGTTFYVFVGEQTTSTTDGLLVYTFTTTPVASWGSGTSIDTTAGSNTITALDSAQLSGILYISFIKGTSAVLRKYNPSGGATSSVTLGAITSPKTVSCSTDSSNSLIWLCAGNLTTFRVASYNTSLTLQVGTTIAGTYVSGSVGMASNSGRAIAVVDGAVWTSGGTITPFPTIHATTCTVSAKPIFDSSGFYVALQSTSTTQSTYFLCGATLAIADTAPTFGKILAKWAKGTAFSQDRRALAQLTLSGTTLTAPFLLLNETLVTGNANTSTPLVSVNRVEITQSMKPKALVGGMALNYFSGSPSFYDNQNLVDIGFNQYPGAATLTQFVSVDGAIANGTYSYRFVYSYIDANGQVTRSAPSTPQQVTVSGANTAVQMDLVGPTFTNKQSVVVEAYRTTAGGLTYHLANSAAVQTVSGAFPAIRINDYVADAQLVSNLQLYTNGGEVDNIAPPTGRIAWTFKTRTIVVPDESRSSFWYSKDTIPGTPLEFSDLFVMNIDPRGGDITAGAQMDDKNIIFKRDLIYYSAGSGPTPSGLNNDFLEPLLISADTGCSDRDSIVLTPQGLLFKSPKGIYLLGRDLSVKYMGSDVEAYNTSTVTSAVLIENKNQVRFTLSSSVVLTYDYFVGQWSVFTPISAVDSCIYQNLFTYLESGGVAKTETPGTFLDGSSAIVMKLVTGWLSLAKVQGFQRIRRLLFLGDYKSAHTLNVQFAHDFNSTPTQSMVITPDVNQTPYQWDVRLVRQKGQTVQITIYDTPTAPYGESLSLSSLALEVGLKRGLNKVKSTWST